MRYLALGQDRLAGRPGTRVGPYTIFRNPDAFPRAFTLAESLPAESDEAARHATLTLAQRIASDRWGSSKERNCRPRGR